MTTVAQGPRARHAAGARAHAVGMVLRVALAVTLAFFALAFAKPVLARQLGKSETEALGKTVADFDAAMRASQFDKVVEISIPPRVIEKMAGKVGAPPDKLRAVIVAQSSKVMAQAKLLAFSMDLAKAQHRELKSGQPYVLIPTRTEMDIGAAGRIVATSVTLANLDGGKWYLLRVADPKQVEMLRESYPEFAGVEFPRGTMENTKK